LPLGCLLRQANTAKPLQLFGFSLLSLPLPLNDIQILLDFFVEYRLGSLASFSDSGPGESGPMA
jgi:hypothetical protein